jgi:hypothetical protein
MVQTSLTANKLFLSGKVLNTKIIILVFGFYFIVFCKLFSSRCLEQKHDFKIQFFSHEMLRTNIKKSFAK